MLLHLCHFMHMTFNSAASNLFKKACHVHAVLKVSYYNDLSHKEIFSMSVMLLVYDILLLYSLDSFYLLNFHFRQAFDRILSFAWGKRNRKERLHRTWQIGCQREK